MGCYWGNELTHGTTEVRIHCPHFVIITFRNQRKHGHMLRNALDDSLTSS